MSGMEVWQEGKRREERKDSSSRKEGKDEVVWMFVLEYDISESSTIEKESEIPCSLWDWTVDSRFQSEFKVEEGLIFLSSTIKEKRIKSSLSPDRLHFDNCEQELGLALSIQPQSLHSLSIKTRQRSKPSSSSSSPSRRVHSFHLC